MSSPQYETSITHRNNIASGLKVFWVRSTGTGDNAVSVVCYSDGSKWLFDNVSAEKLTSMGGELLQSSSGAIISLRKDSRLDIFVDREAWLASLSSDTAKLQPKAERQVRFVWNIGAAQDEFKDLPEQGGGYADLYDRQEKEVVMRIHHKYGQLLCLETTKPNDAPLTALAEWLNAIDNDTLKSEGIAISRPPFAPPVAPAKRTVVFTGRLVGTCVTKEIRLDIESIKSAGVGVDHETGNRELAVNTRDGKTYIAYTDLQFEAKPAL